VWVAYRAAASEVDESQQFWAAAEAAVATETAEQRRERGRIETDIDAWMDAPS
jgi:hypothetical protein